MGGGAGAWLGVGPGCLEGVELGVGNSQSSHKITGSFKENWPEYNYG